MTKVASFLGRPMNEVEYKTLVSILKEEVEIVPCHYKIIQGRGRVNDIIEAIPQDCDVVVVKTHIFITRWISELVNLPVLNFKRINKLGDKSFKGWRVFNNGYLVDYVPAV